MLAAWNRPGPKRWPRGQKFALTSAGAVAETAYQTTVSEARSAGRAVLDAALAAWAEPLGVGVNDGVVLGELRAGRAGVPELIRTLEPAGFAPDEVRAAVERLVGAAMVEPLPLPSRAAASP